MVAVNTTGQAKDCTTRIRVPIRSTEAGEGRHHIHAVAVFHFGGEVFRVIGITDKLQLITQPLDGCTANKHRTFQCIVNFTARAAGDSGQQAMIGLHCFCASVHQQEAAGTVGVFCHSRLDTKLAEQRGLLVTGNPGDRNTSPAFTTNVGLAVNF
ncbi:Uncharacterised protein [Yersinia enterocolitica]|nr:Uncharacterised protein [Yersinia enterocolitica]